MNRTIYVAMDALLAPSDKPDPHLGTGIAPYAKPFLTWATTHGRPVVLTDGPLSHAVYLVDKLDVKGKVAVRGFDMSKTELFSPHEDFYLVDDALIPSEISWFAEHGLGHRVIPCGAHGVTEQARDALHAAITKHKK